MVYYTGLDYWDSILGWFTGMVYWDGILGWYTEIVYWDGILGWFTGATHHHLLLFLRKHFHLDSLCKELMVEKIFHSESADKRNNSN